MSGGVDKIESALRECGHKPQKKTPVRLDSEGVLLCPKCAGNYLHHERVTVFDVRGEDAPEVELTEVEKGNIFHAVVSREIAGTPSARRDGVAIMFSCELCDTYSELTIAQHKGQTDCGWRDPPDIEKAYSRFSAQTEK